MFGNRHPGRGREAVLDVLVALAEDLQIQRQHQCGAAGGLRAVDQAIDEVAVAHHVELEPERLVGVLGHVLDRADAHRRERERHAGLGGGPRRQDLAVGVLHAGEPGRRERDRHTDRLSDHRARERAVRHVDGDALAQLDLGEVRLVGAVGALRPGAGVGVVVEHARNASLCENAQVLDAGGRPRCEQARHSRWWLRGWHSGGVHGGDLVGEVPWSPTMTPHADDVETANALCR